MHCRRIIAELGLHVLHVARSPRRHSLTVELDGRAYSATKMEHIDLEENLRNYALTFRDKCASHHFVAHSIDPLPLSARFEYRRMEGLIFRRLYFETVKLR